MQIIKISQNLFYSVYQAHIAMVVQETITEI